MSLRVALITGITGQDGAYLAEFLLDKGYEVHGIKRRTSLFNTDRIDHLYQDPHEQRPALHPALRRPDRLARSLIRIVQQVQPDEIYNLAAQSHVAVSLRGARVHRQLRRAWARCACSRRSASSAWRRRRASTRPRPRSSTAWCRRRRRRRPRPSIRAPPTRVAKLYAYWITVNYREAYGMYACNGILFNHESPDPRRDLRHAQDHARAGAHQARPAGLPVPRQPRRAARLGPRPRLRRDAVADAAAGRARGLRHRHRRAAQRARVRRAPPRRSSASRIALGRARAPSEKGYDCAAARTASSRVDPRYFRPTEVETLLGDPTKAQGEARLGARRSRFDELVAEMVREDLQHAPSATSWSRRTATRPIDRHE